MIYAYWHKPPIVFQGRVASSYSPLVYPVQYLDVDSYAVGNPSLVVPGMTMLLGSYAGGSDLGRCRIKKASGSSTIYPAWSEQGVHDGELTPSIGAYVTVLAEYRLWAKIPRINISTDPNILPTIWMDGDILSADYPTAPPPVANVGPSEAGSPDPSTGLYEVNFDVNDSWQFITNNGWSTINSGHFTWSFGGGTIVSGSTTTRQATVRYPPGLYTAKLDVQSDQGVLHTARKVIFVRNPVTNADVLPHQIMSHTQSPKGQEISIRFFKNMDPDVYRDGSLLLVWEDDPELANGRRMIFSGWHLSDDSSMEHQRTADIGDTTFKFVDINGLLETKPGFSQEMNYNGAGAPATAGTWNVTPFNNVLFYMCFLLHWQSTALEIADLVIDNYTLPLRNFLRLTSDADNLYNQVNKLANMMVPDFYLTCTQAGQMRLSIDVGLMVLADRPNFAPDLGILAAPNWENVTVENRRAPRVSELMSGAIKSSSTYVYDASGNLIIDTFWCIAPGITSRGQGPDFQQSTGHLTDDQYTLNYIEGNRYARLNSPYGNVVVTATWQANQFQHMDPGTMGRLQVWFGGESPPRPPIAYFTYCMIKEISWTYEYQSTGLLRTLTFTLEVETDGPSSVTIDRPIGLNI